MSSNSTSSTMLVKRTDGTFEHFDKLKLGDTLNTLSFGLDHRFLKLNDIMSSLEERLPTNPMTTSALRILLAEVSASFSARHPDYSLLAGRILALDLQKGTEQHFSTWALRPGLLGLPNFDPLFIGAVREHSSVMDAAVKHYRDFFLSYRALSILTRSHLMRLDRQITERVQFLYMRLAVSIHLSDIDNVLDTYDMLSTGKYSHASPTMWNAGTAEQNSASCYIFRPRCGSGEDALESASEIGRLWQSDGGVGIDLSAVNMTSDTRLFPEAGVLPLLKIYDSIAQYWSRCTRHRSSTAAAYIPVWHPEVRSVILCRTSRAPLGYRFSHIFPALWIPDVFMQRLRDDGSWSFFDPIDAATLLDTTGAGFTREYVALEEKGVAICTMPARRLWAVISDALRESGTPFLLYADNVNARNNQMHLGIIRSSNLCSEIVQYSSDKATSVCTLASIALPKFLRDDGTFDFEDLHRVTKKVVVNLNKVVSASDYPTPEAISSGFGTRALGIGVQGLADLFAALEYPFTSQKARDLNVLIFETIYHAALESSCEIARLLGPHETWRGSPASMGVLQVNMWDAETSQRYDFDALRADIQKHGLRNSMLTAQMPTASTSQILGNSEGIEPYSSNIIQYRLLSGTFTEVSRPLVTALNKRGLWSNDLRDAIVQNHGSVQAIDIIPDDVKAVFRTAFEIDPRDLIDMAADRAPFIDQSQSLSLFVDSPSPDYLMELQLYAWEKRLKTGQYYLRSRPSTEGQSYGLEVGTLQHDLGLHARASEPPEDASCPCDA